LKAFGSAAGIVAVTENEPAVAQLVGCWTDNNLEVAALIPGQVVHICASLFTKQHELVLAKVGDALKLGK